MQKEAEAEEFADAFDRFEVSDRLDAFEPLERFEGLEPLELAELFELLLDTCEPCDWLDVPERFEPDKAEEAPEFPTEAWLQGGKEAEDAARPADEAGVVPYIK